MDYYADLGIEIDGFAKGGMPARNKKNFRSTKSGAGMTAAGVRAYRRMNPGSKLKTAVTGKVKKGSKSAKRRASYCRRSKGQMKMHNINCSKTPEKRICLLPKKKMEMLEYIKKILGIDKLEYKIRMLERKNYWREKYKHGLSERKHTSNILPN